MDLILIVRALDRIYGRIQTFKHDIISVINSIRVYNSMIYDEDEDFDQGDDYMKMESGSTISHRYRSQSLSNHLKSQFKLIDLTDQFVDLSLDLIDVVSQSKIHYYFQILFQNTIESIMDLRHSLSSMGLNSSRINNGLSSDELVNL